MHKFHYYVLTNSVDRIALYPKITEAPTRNGHCLWITKRQNVKETGFADGNGEGICQKGQVAVSEKLRIFNYPLWVW